MTGRRRELLDTARFAVGALWSHKLRAGLTALSMLIANASIIAAVSFAAAGRDFVIAQIEGVGSNLVYAFYEAGGNVSAAEADYITEDDVTAVREGLGGMVAAVAGVMSSWDWISIDGRPRQIRVLGSSEDYGAVRNLRLLAGRFLDHADVEDREKSALLTGPLARKLHGSAAAAVGQAVRVHGVEFHVVGVFEEGVETFGQSEVAGDSVLIPISVIRYFQPVERIDPLYVSVRRRRDVDRAAERVREILESRHRPGSLYRVVNLGMVLAAAERIAVALNVLLAVTAAVMLSISGIFIMSIMMISVTERTREIGVHMAVGANRRRIRLQFLTEAVAVSLLGGGLGVGIGLALPAAANRLLPLLDAPLLSQLLVPTPTGWAIATFLISGSIGAVFGLAPASRAAQLNPVEALRHE